MEENKSNISAEPPINELNSEIHTRAEALTAKRKNLKEALDENKVYFEVFSLVIIGIMGIVLSISAVFISIKANDIAAEQLLVSELQNMPMFNISGESGKAYFDEKQNEMGVTMVIKNNGGQITNATIYARTVVEFKIRDEDFASVIQGRGTLSGTYDQAWAPYDGNTNTFTLKRNKAEVLNNMELSLLLAAILNNPYQHMDIQSIEIKEYVRIEYTDYRSIVHSDLFEISSKVGFSKIVDEDYQIDVLFETININTEVNLPLAIIDEVYYFYNYYKENPEEFDN